MSTDNETTAVKEDTSDTSTPPHTVIDTATDVGRTNDSVNDINAPATPAVIPASQVEMAPTPTQCSCCPHGFNAVVIASFCTFAWFARLVQNGCDYAILTGPIVAELTNNPDIPFLEVGFNQYREPSQDVIDGTWYADYYNTCNYYDTDVVTIGGLWKFAKITAFISLVTGGGGALFLWFSSCTVFSKSTWRWAGYEILVASVCQALTFSWFGTDLCRGNDGENACSLHFGSRADIWAFSFWLLSAIAILARYPSPRKDPAADSTRGEQQPPVSSDLEMAESVAETEAPPEGRRQPVNTLNIPEIS